VFRSVLIANRGEIAVRIARTCRRLGIRTIAVYSDADAGALHVREADEAHRLGPGPAVESYLEGARVLAVAARAGAEALHPGYGFLAENADFVDACEAAGVVWIGPPAAAMRTLGDKARAKALAVEVGVPVLSGYHGEEQDPSRLAAHAAELGFPLMIKAAAGGGGRGMRVVERAAEFEAAAVAAAREARAGFGDGRLLLERYVARPRHVEVQVMADASGRVLHLGERDCSIQRRHQKLVEESPSPSVGAERRAELGAAAARLVEAAGYRGAGTVEFILDEADRFAFLEVNTRLQVEHPVTELVTGLDLVEMQLRVAAGEPLGVGQADVALSGHAIEARLIAEDPDADFAPSVGRIDELALPAGAGVRVDTGVERGSVVTQFYDSLLAKLIVLGPSRPVAVARLREALLGCRVGGVATNLDALLAIAETPAFAAGAVHTGFLAEQRTLEAAHPPAAVIAAAAAHDLTLPAAADPWRGPVPWRVGRMGQPSAWSGAGGVRVARLDQQPGAASAVRVDVEGVGIDVRLLGAGALVVDGDRAEVSDRPPERLVRWRGRTYRLRRPSPPDPELLSDAGPVDGAGAVVAPMPGQVIAINVREGDRVEMSQVVAVLEAMKMEHQVSATQPGIVSAVLVAANELVASGQPLIEVRPDGEP
jgi:3-methylcrotonyl-CoA carboxylase alpha subunit